jgi:hypothetical protein
MMSKASLIAVTASVTFAAVIGITNAMANQSPTPEVTVTTTLQPTPSPSVTTPPLPDLPTASTAKEAVVNAIKHYCPDAPPNAYDISNWRLWDPNSYQATGMWQVSGTSDHGELVLDVTPAPGIAIVSFEGPYAEAAFMDWSCPNTMSVRTVK